MESGNPQMQPLWSLVALAPLTLAATWLATPLDILPGLGLLALGLILWTLLEYLLHRYAHLSGFTMSEGRRPHLGHHARPTDLTVMVTPLWFTLPVSVALWGCLRFVLASWATASAVLMGVLIGYVAYEIVHYRIHIARRPGRLLRWLRDYHYHHHFRNASEQYGITTPLWDFVFRSSSRGSSAPIQKPISVQLPQSPSNHAP